MTKKEFDIMYQEGLTFMRQEYPTGRWDRVSYGMRKLTRKPRGTACRARLGCINMITGLITYNTALLDEWEDESADTIIHELYHWTGYRKHSSMYRLVVESLTKRMLLAMIAKGYNIPAILITKYNLNKQSKPITPKPKPVAVPVVPVQAVPTPIKLASTKQTYAIKAITWVDIRNLSAFKGLTYDQADKIIKDLNKYDKAVHNGYALTRRTPRKQLRLYQNLKFTQGIS